MKQRSKNYLNLMAGLLLLYFLVLTLFSGVEARHDLERLNPGESVQMGLAWYVLAACLGAGMLACLGWAVVSKGNRFSLKETCSHPLNDVLLVLGTFLGGACSLGLCVMMLGSMPSFRLSNPSSTSTPGSLSAASLASASSASSSLEQEEEIPPNEIFQALGAVTVSSSQLMEAEQLEAALPGQSAVLVAENGELTLNQETIIKSGNASSLKNAGLYGLNAALITAPNGRSQISQSQITTMAEGSAAAAVNGENASMELFDTALETQGSASPAVLAVYGGQAALQGGTLKTAGPSSADFQIGQASSVLAQGLSAQSQGADSPLVSCKGIFTGANLEGTALNAPIAQISAGGEVSFTGSTLCGQPQPDQGLFVFSGSGSRENPARLAMNGTSWKPAAQESMNFEVRDCAAVINLTANTAPSASQAARAVNGSLTLNLQSQSLEGQISADSSSALDITMIEGSRFAGSINADGSCPSSALHLDGSSTVSMTADFYLSGFGNGDPSNANIQTNGFHIYLNGEILL